jgi:hypothetical protein
MSAPFDRPAYGDPGGCDCHNCGVIFIGAPWHTLCAVCDSDAAAIAAPCGDMAVPQDQHARPEGIARTEEA